MTTPTAPSPRPAVVFGLMALISAVWGSTWLVIRTGLHDLPPLFAAGVRFMVAGGRDGGARAVAPRAWKAARGHRRGVVDREQALCQFTGNFALVYWCETVIPSGLVSVLWATFPADDGAHGGTS